MKTIQEVIDNYSKYATLLDDRFGVRFAEFLSAEQIPLIGFSLKEGAAHEPIPFTRENVLAQLEKDVRFGMEKARDLRGISSELMFYVVRSWNKVLEEGLEDFSIYGSYGMPLFRETAKKYGWEI
ncbi:hypothetical protein [Paenibacillus apis]|uniref:Uncharacterized protein n=1 Tax=Paenibacillus apis TaxID=1792174 RepID=A0A920CMD6_9BACL|nr:hypothetical protein [Paenibacillus apis]GIO42508.1 hypothetical protein J41TS4_22660 [Paenibacillus apis]